MLTVSFEAYLRYMALQPSRISDRTILVIPEAPRVVMSVVIEYFRPIRCHGTPKGFPMGPRWIPVAIVLWPLFCVWYIVGISGFQIRFPYQGPMEWTLP